MSGRTKTWWFDDFGAPRNGWTEIPDLEDEPLEEIIRNEERMEVLRGALGELTAKQRFVVECAWGIRGERIHSFREIAELMSVSEMAVRKHHKAAMKSLRVRISGGLGGNHV